MRRPRLPACLPPRLPRQPKRPQQQGPLEGRHVNKDKHPLGPRGLAVRVPGATVLWAGPAPPPHGAGTDSHPRCAGQLCRAGAQAPEGMLEVQGSR